MDESAYHSTRKEIAPAPCVFEKALLAACATCSLSMRHSVAEREIVACGSPKAKEECALVLHHLREKSVFALHVQTTARILPHAAMMKIKCGGLAGLKAVLAPEMAEVDVRHLVQAALATEGGLEELPWPRVMQGVAAWHIRKRHRPKDEA